MTDSEKLDLLLAEIQGMKTDMREMKSDLQILKRKMTDIEAHLENTTDSNIRLAGDYIAHMSEKVNQLVIGAGSNIGYEIKMNSLDEELRKLKLKVMTLGA